MLFKNIFQNSHGQKNQKHSNRTGHRCLCSSWSFLCKIRYKKICLNIFFKFIGLYRFELKFLKTEENTEQIGEVQLEPINTETVDENNTENSVDEVEETIVNDNVVFLESKNFFNDIIRPNLYFTIISNMSPRMKKKQSLNLRSPKSRMLMKLLPRNFHQ